jgi:hypothetical protein
MNTLELEVEQGLGVGLRRGERPHQGTAAGAVAARVPVARPAQRDSLLHELKAIMAVYDGS